MAHVGRDSALEGSAWRISAASAGEETSKHAAAAATPNETPMLGRWSSGGELCV